MLIKVAEDKGQQKKKHEVKHKWFADNGIELVSLPLPVGDYILLDDRVQAVIDRRGSKLKKMDLLGVTKISVDTKKDLGEVTNNICGKSHARFRDECILAQQNGIKLIVLVEHSRCIRSLDDVEHWKNPRQYQYEQKIRRLWGIPKGADFSTEVAELKAHGAKINRGPTTGPELAASMRTMSEKYGVVWKFCDKKETGRIILEILQEGTVHVAEKTV